MEDVLAQYYEDLLRVQYRVSESVQQMLPRGTIREDFLSELVTRRRSSLRAKKGIVIKRGVQSGECDLIFHDYSAAVTPLGELIMIEPLHCKLILEVKSNASGRNFTRTNENFKTVKEIDPDIKPICGLFCYNTSLTKKTVLTRFGWTYDNDIKGWREMDSATYSYPNIDFIICVASSEPDEDCTDEQYFLIKDGLTGRYNMRSEYPIIKNLLAITDNL